MTVALRLWTARKIWGSDIPVFNNYRLIQQKVTNVTDQQIRLQYIVFDVAHFFNLKKKKVTGSKKRIEWNISRVEREKKLTNLEF